MHNTCRYVALRIQPAVDDLAFQRSPCPVFRTSTALSTWFLPERFSDDWCCMSAVMLQSSVPGIPVRRGKVRDVYDFGDRLLFVASDRISAFDYVLPNGIPRKGEVLTRLSQFWFSRLSMPHHWITSDVSALPLPAGTDMKSLAGRSMVVMKTSVIPVECVVRGYLAGSGWKEYRQSGTVCGIRLPDGLKGKQPPARTRSLLRQTKPNPAMMRTSALSRCVRSSVQNSPVDCVTSVCRCTPKAARMRLPKGSSWPTRNLNSASGDEEIILIDEVLTPDSSRFWPADQYEPGRGQASYDKQFVRDWLEQSGWDKNSPPPVLPDDVVQRTSFRYIEAYERLTGLPF